MKMCLVLLPTGQVTNAVIIPAPANMFLSDSRPAVPLPRFSRHLNPSEQGEGAGTGGVSLRLGTYCQVCSGKNSLSTGNIFYQSEMKLLFLSFVSLSLFF